MGLGLIIAYIGYAIVFWGVAALQGRKQPSFGYYLLPRLVSP
jgi:hypothetical protein